MFKKLLKLQRKTEKPKSALSGNVFQMATEFQRKGDFQQAEALYKEILQHEPDNVEALHSLGMLFFQAGNLESAAEFVSKAIALFSEDSTLYFDLGFVLAKTGNFDAAIQNYLQAIALQPGYIGAHYNLGIVFEKSGQIDKAVACYREIIALAPDLVDAYNSLGLALEKLGHIDEAADNYQAAIDLQPDNFAAYSNLGRVQATQRNFHLAIENFRQALKLEPDYADVNNNLGCLLAEQGEFEQALPYFQKFTELCPDNAQGYFNLGNAFYRQKNFDLAVENCHLALKFNPGHAGASNVLGCSLLEQGNIEQAIAYLQHFTKLSPDSAEGYFNLGSAFFKQNNIRGVVENFQKALSIQPDYPLPEPLLHITRYACCSWASYSKTRERIIADVEQGVHSCYPFTFLAVSSSMSEQKQCVENFAKYFPPHPPLCADECYRHDKIRIAYVSGNFGEHPINFLMAGLFEQHDRDQFEIFAISLSPQVKGEYEKRIRNVFDRFIDVSEKNEYEIATLMRSLEIDIAIDLMGWTNEGSRFEIFAYRPAPVQVNYLGYPGSAGADYIDYIIADSYLIPSEYQSFYTEKIVYLPDCFQANDDKRQISPYKPARKEVGLPESGFVFCAFNHAHKFNPPLFDIWMNLLKAVPDSVLWLVADYEAAENNLLDEAEKRGVDSRRLVFARQLPYPEHLARFQLADLFLDTLPFNAGTTASDALWAGVPVLTCSDEAFASRMAGSLLHAIGLPELIAGNFEEYEALALRLAKNPEKLAEIKARLAENRETHPLFDTRRFARHLESAYVAMWERHQRGEAPETFNVSLSEHEVATSKSAIGGA